MDSILITTKKLLGIEDEYKHFDTDICIAINTAFMTLQQIGVGPKEGFSITDESAVWDDFTPGRTDLEAIKTYVYLNVRLVFDPPQNSFLVEAIKDQIKELTWRLNVQSDAPT